MSTRERFDLYGWAIAPLLVAAALLVEGGPGWGVTLAVVIFGLREQERARSSGW